MTKLLAPEPKNRTYGFIIVDAKTQTPLMVSGSGLLLATKEPSFFRITPRQHRETSTTRPRMIDYAFARKKAGKAIDRHNRALAALQRSSMTRDWARVEKAKAITPKIQPVKTPL